MTESAETIRQTVVELLSHVSGSKEVRTYLQRFAGLDAERFGIIKIGGAILEEQLEETAAALAFLHQVGLTPVVIHGGGPQLDRAMAEAGLVPEKIDGLRVTTPEVLEVARKVFLAQNLRLVEAVRARGVEAHTLNAGVIEADYLDQQRFGLVGQATGIQQDLIRSVIASGAVPILTCLGVTPGGQIVNINGDAVVTALVHVLQPMKIIFLSGAGGLLDDGGEIIDTINLTTDYEPLMQADWLHSGMRLKLEEIRKLLGDLPLESSVSITRPQELVRELFTHGGSGTYIRQGEGIVEYTDRTAIDGVRLSALVEESFSRQLKPDWWDGLDLRQAIITEQYRAAAVVTTLPGGGVPYLDKFAVAESARGEGLAKGVWQQLERAEPHFFLRSRKDNGFNDFYHNQTDGAVRRGEWVVFWRGDVDLVSAAQTIDRIAALPESFD